jgi:hypothetical protein
MVSHPLIPAGWLVIGLAVLPGCPGKTHHPVATSPSGTPAAAGPGATLPAQPGQLKLRPPVQPAERSARPSDLRVGEADLDAVGEIRRAAARPGVLPGAPIEANLPDMAVRSVRVIQPTGVPEDVSDRALRIVELQIMHRGLPVRGGALVAYFLDRSLSGLRGRIAPRSSHAEAFRGVDPARAIGEERARRVIFAGAEVPPGPPFVATGALELAWDLRQRRLVYVGWDEETRTVADALTGQVLSRTRFGPIPGWDPYDRATLTGLALAHPAPVELDWPLETILGALQDFPDSLVDRKVTGWLQLTSGWIPKDCSFRLSWGAGEGLESAFPFPSLYPGDTFDVVETRDAPCFANPFTQRPAATDPSPAATRRSLAYQNNYLYGMMAARQVAWNGAAATYLFLEPRQRLALHIKALTPVGGPYVCGSSYACYVEGTHTIRIVDDILFANLVFHEYGHYVHHTYRPASFPQASCLVRATQEGVADAMRSSLLALVHGDAPSDAGFLGPDFSTATRAVVRPAIRLEEECSPNAYGDGSVIGQIMQALLNDRYCTFDESLGASAPCRVERILGDARAGGLRVPLWGRQALAHAMMYTGSWSTPEDPPSPYLFVDTMAYWFRVLSEVYEALQPAEWDRLRALFLMHGIDIGPFQP